MKEKDSPIKVAKKRGRPKKNATSQNQDESSSKQMKITDSLKKVKRTVNRFKGVTKEELLTRFLPDRIKPGLDILIIGINPGLYAAYKGHHYAGPGNHFWQCINLSKLVDKYVTSDNDLDLLNYGIGFSTIVQRTTPSAKDLTSKEIREGGVQLIEKIQKYRPKIAVFNGKGIYEIFSKEMFGQKKKDFTFGKQIRKIPDTETVIFVMPSSSARCAQFPRAQDKVHYYIQIKQIRDEMRGQKPSTDVQETDYIFDLAKATELAKVSSIKQEMVDPSYNDQSGNLNAELTNGNAFPLTNGGNNPVLPSTSKEQAPTSAIDQNNNSTNKKIFPQSKNKQSNLVKNHAHIAKYLSSDTGAGPSTAIPSNAKKRKSDMSLSPQNPCLQQEVSEEHKSERIGSWVRDQQGQNYEDVHPPMGFDEPEDTNDNAGNAGSDHASQQSQQSAASAGISASTYESTSGYGSIDTSSRHVRQDRVEMWVIDQNSQPPPTQPIASTTTNNNSILSELSSSDGHNATIGSSDCNSVTAATTALLPNVSLPLYTLPNTAMQQNPSTTYNQQFIRRVNYEMTNAVRPPVPLFSMWGRETQHQTMQSNTGMQNHLNLGYSSQPPPYHQHPPTWQL